MKSDRAGPGESTLSPPWVKRRHLLQLLELNGSAWCTEPAFGGEPELDAFYLPGERSQSWVKVKTADWREHHVPERHERVR